MSFGGNLFFIEIEFIEERKRAFVMHLALSTMHRTLLSGKASSLLEAISAISFSLILLTRLGSKPANASLHLSTFGKPLVKF